ncbi:winged helix DNA-binding protein [Porphyromonas circumdentaria]|uniref:DNA-binding transcriptional regulator, MarR family n=1 Tax=Porphyromonas circumdentaria TaxID=29524 RepID=A0A1T4Q2R9_9PORP|nr:winged helix DNA-binding protein [Porphyromonas circumdentaria]MBB6276432.1 DNA-binding MarR family transcriptional regulator [Porphyromonas circumdentaria]MDO4723071.1 winged helix DNA-binding protein [Porphyromonas circumdentaria]SJZ97498.1 DNA-binding transcriptional regulator, MarR family [Porphyromonas circumdentaria]
MKTVCAIRDLYKVLHDFETTFEETYSLSLNEAMVLCALGEIAVPTIPSQLGAQIGFRNSHLSKLLRRLEQKELISRSLGQEDRRQMFFALTSKGEERIQQLDLEQIEIPEMLRPLLKLSSAVSMKP